MTPTEEHALEAGRGGLAYAPVETGSLRRAYLRLPVLSELLALLILTLIVRIGFGIVDLMSGAFVLAVALLRIATLDGSERLHLAALDGIAASVRSVALAFATVAFATLLVPGLGDLRSSESLFVLVVVSAPALIIARSIHYAAYREAARRGQRSRTLVVGAGAVAQEIVSVLRTDGSYGLDVAGAVDDDARFNGHDLGAPILGPVSSLSEIVQSHGIGSIIVAFTGTPDTSTLRAVREALLIDIDVWVVPRFFEMGAPPTGFDHIGSVPIIRVHAPASSRRGWKVKRALDVLASSLGLVIASPILAAIALAVKLESRGPVLFKQSRVGMDQRRFSIYKFRTMRVEAESEEAGWTARSDRITRVGRVLRDSGLDELPQLFNVLKGDLTLVGPRPERPQYVELFDSLYPHYAGRHRVPAGITGWAQIHGLRGDTSIDERARFDNYYIENWSFTRDLKILFLTWRTWLSRYKGSTEAEEESSQVERSAADLVNH